MQKNGLSANETYSQLYLRCKNGSVTSNDKKIGKMGKITWLTFYLDREMFWISACTNEF